MKCASLAVACGLALFTTSAGAQTLYSNGAFVTHPGGHVSGEDVSLAQDVTYPGYTSLGFAAGPEWQLADDFIIPYDKIWNITSVTLYAYQAGSSAPFTDARLIIWRGIPDFLSIVNPSVKVFDGSAANVLGTSTPVAYRIAQSLEASAPFTDTARHVQALTIQLPQPLTLEGGRANTGGTQYWIDWKLTGPQGGLVYSPPVSILGQAYTAVGGLARQKCPVSPVQPDCTPGQWRAFENGTSPNLVDLPFVLNGTSFTDTIFTDGFDTVEDDDP